MEAWKGNYLNNEYFSKWLDEMAVELNTLEDSVAPDGWTCQWDKYVTYNLLRLYKLTKCLITKESKIIYFIYLFIYLVGVYSY